MRPRTSPTRRTWNGLPFAALAILAASLALAALAPVDRSGTGFSLAATLGAASFTFEVAAGRIDLSVRTETP